MIDMTVMRHFTAIASAFTVCAALLLTDGVRAAELRAFDAKSMDAIRATHAGKRFVLVFWSLYCEPCREEMGQWSALQRKHPGVPFILVDTDLPQDRASVEKFLANHKLGKIETWVFADEFTERVRFSVDRKWRGELPRTYFFDAGHRFEAHSGLVSPQWIESWLVRQDTKGRR
jgi:thiol-disulfide isomerase/thioredoxin